MSTQINDYVKENIVLFLAGEKDVDAEWDAMWRSLTTSTWMSTWSLRQMAYTRQYGDAAETAETSEAE